MLNIRAAKPVVSFVVTNSISFTASAVLSANVPTKNNLQKVGLYVGSMAIGSYVGEKMTPWVNEKFDNAATAIEKITTKSTTSK